MKVKTILRSAFYAGIFSTIVASTWDRIKNDEAREAFCDAANAATLAELERLRPEFERMAAEIGEGTLRVSARYKPGGSDAHPEMGIIGYQLSCQGPSVLALTGE